MKEAVWQPTVACVVDDDWRCNVVVKPRVTTKGRETGVVATISSQITIVGPQLPQPPQSLDSIALADVAAAATTTSDAIDAPKMSGC
jgi:hypothetical protein